jgi:hypothetical protein
MKFEEAIVMMRQGCAVVMDGWVEENAIMLNDGKLVMVRPKWDGGFWVVNEAGATNKWILNETWQVVWSPKKESPRSDPWHIEEDISRVQTAIIPLVGVNSVRGMVALDILRLGYEVHHGNIMLISAIKALREVTNWILKDAKLAIELGKQIAAERDGKKP